jgi:uncharacterized protein (TIGR00251 family)
MLPKGVFVEGTVLQRGDIPMKLEKTARGIVVNARVSPGAKEFAVDASGDELRIRLTAAPDKGAANEELERRLGELLGAEVRITHGLKSRRKKLLITGLKGPVTLTSIAGR